MKSTLLLERLLIDRRGLRPGSWSAYLVAAAIVAAATTVRLLLAPWVVGVQFVTFFPAVILASFVCGGAAGFLAVALSALSAWAFVMAPAFAFQHLYALVLFVVVGALDVVIISALRAAVARVGHLNASLRDSEMRYRTLADNASDLIMLQDIHHDTQYISPAIRRLLGYEPDELRASRAERLVHPDDLETLVRSRRALSADALTTKSSFRVRHKNGSYIWVEAIFNWVAAGADGHPHILTVARDISERKAAEDATNRLQALLNDAIAAIDDGIAIYDSEERLIVANAAMRRLSGAPGELLEPGRTFMQIVEGVRSRIDPSADDERFVKFRARRAAQFRRADGVPQEWRMQNGGWLLVRDFRTREGDVVSVVSDITGLKTAAIEIDRAREKAEAANIAKSRFLAAASHDLRQPLQTIALLQGILQKTVTDPRASSMIDKLGMSLNAMSGMLDTLLEVNQLEAGIVKPKIEDFAIGDLLERLRIELAYHAMAKGLTLRVVRSNAVVRSDPRLLEQIIRNLLSNAIKYTKKGKILFGCRRRGAALRIDVLDTGIGIPDDQIEAIFEEFHQVDNPARDRRLGLGLGLSIVKRLSDLLDHPINVRSVLDKGSVFSIEVRRGEPSGVPLMSTSQPAPSAKRTGILFVEDDPAVREAMRMLLELLDHKVVVAEDAAHALAHLRQTNWRPEVIVSDFNLPGGVNGLELIKLVRSDLREQIPAVLLTGDVSPATLETLTAAGCTLLSKPVDADTLIAAIERCQDVRPKAPIEV